MDISISACIRRGEKRNNYNFTQPKLEFSGYPNAVNVKAKVLWHRKHEGLLFRNAEGGFEKKGKPRFYADWFE